MRSDEELIRQLQSGNSEAFSVFVKRHQDRIYRMAWLWLKSPQEADDVLQEVLLRSYTGFARFQFRSSPATWILRVTRNVCHEFNRRWQRNVQSSLEEKGPGAQEHWSREQSRQRVRALVGCLPPRQREVVSLRVFEEMSTRDTAAVMGCRPGTVKALLNRALNQLKREMGEDLR